MNAASPRLASAQGEDKTTGSIPRLPSEPHQGARRDPGARPTFARLSSTPVEEKPAPAVPDRPAAAVPDTPAESGRERRREERIQARFQAIVQFPGGSSREMQLADISTHGCRVDGEVEGFRVGRFISVGIDETSMLQAVVRWVRNDAAGMEFLRPIPPERTEWHDLMDMPF